MKLDPELGHWAQLRVARFWCGHEKTPGNMTVSGNSKNRCRICSNEDRKYMADLRHSTDARRA